MTMLSSDKTQVSGMNKRIRGQIQAIDTKRATHLFVIELMYFKGQTIATQRSTVMTLRLVIDEMKKNSPTTKKSGLCSHTVSALQEILYETE